MPGRHRLQKSESTFVCVFMCSGSVPLVVPLCRESEWQFFSVFFLCEYSKQTTTKLSTKAKAETECECSRRKLAQKKK